MYISIPKGEVFNTPPNKLIARIVRSEEVNGDYTEFFNAVKDYLSPIHYCVESEEGKNHDFLSVITKFFNTLRADGNLIKVDDNVEVYKTIGYGNFIYVYDCGYCQFRCDCFETINELYEWISKFEE